MKTKFIKLTMMVLVLITAAACSDDQEEDDNKEWIRGVDFDGLPRSGAASFTIGEDLYVTTGYGTSSNRFTDTWFYDVSTALWTAKSAFPGEARNNAVAFSINGKGYVGLGTNGTRMFNDFYEYDPQTDTWKAIANFPGTARYGAVSFVVSNTPYVGCGKDIDAQDFNDFYTYNASADSWTKVSSTPEKRSFAFSFVINNIAYLGGGTNNNAYVSSFYAFDGQTWTAKEPLSGRTDDYTYDLRRSFPAVFVVGSYGFITGGANSSVLSSTWRYDPANDFWVEHDDFTINGASSRQQAIGFSSNGVGYVVGGRSGSIPFDDIWKFTPDLAKHPN